MNDLITSGTTSVNDCFVQLTPEIIDFKVGLFNSRTRLGRVGQALGSRTLPGDTSGLRHPVRSTAYQGLTPGGGGNNRLGRRVGGPQKFVRCPVGFEFGGRFAGRNFDNCGRSVFTLPIEGIPSGITNPLAGAVPNFTAVLPDAPRGTIQQIVSQITDAHAIQVMRNASIPKLGASNKTKVGRAVAVAADAVGGKGKASSLFVRRDGITLSPTMSITEMGKLRNNPDMVGGTFVSRLSEPASMGKDDIPVLLRSSLGGISYGFAGGARIDIVKKRDLSPSEARRLTGVFNRAQATQDNYIYDAALIALKEASGNAIEYTGYFPGVPKPYEQITVTNKDGQTRLVPRWVYHIFLAASAPQRGSGGSWSIVESAIAKLNPKQKVKSLDDGSLVNQNKQNLIEFKTISFISENDFSRYAFEAKTVAAVWDDKLPPSGGFRCPPGTRYGGRITDRFGRNCGWNISRRLANQLENIGHNIGERLDDRRDRRVGRRVERRLGRAERGVGRAERRLEGAQQRLNNLRGGDANVGTSRRSRRVRRGAGRVEGVAQRLDDFADRRDRGERRKRRGSRTDRVEGVAQRLDDFADRRDRGVRRERRGNRTDRLDARAKRREERQARRLERRQRRDERVGRAASRLDNFADRRDGISRTDRNNARRQVTNDRAPRIPDQGMRPRPGTGLPRIPDQGFDREPRPNRPRPDRPNDRVPSRKPSGRGERVVSDEIKPSAADMRNVRNRFRQDGLPDSPFWRDGEDNERNRELARRFDRYYDENGDLTALGEAINARLADESARPPRQPRRPRQPRPAVPDRVPSARPKKPRPDPSVRPNDAPNTETAALLKAYDDRREALNNLNFDARLKQDANDALDGKIYNLFEEIDRLKDQPFEVQNLNDLKERFRRQAEEASQRIQEIDGNNIDDHNIHIAHLQAIQEIDDRLAALENDLNNVANPSAVPLDDLAQAQKKMQNHLEAVNPPDWLRQHAAEQLALSREAHLANVENVRGVINEADLLQNLRDANVNQVVRNQDRVDNGIGMDFAETGYLLRDNVARIEANQKIDKRLAEIAVISNGFDTAQTRQLNIDDLRRRAGLAAQLDAVRNNIAGMDQQIRDAQDAINGIENLPATSDAYMRLQRENAVTALRDHIEKVRVRKAERIVQNQRRVEQRAARLQGEAANNVDDGLVGDPAKVFAERVAAVNEKRRKILSKYLRSRYGDTDKPWLDPAKNPNVDELKSLAQILDSRNATPEAKLAAKQKLQDWAEAAFGHSDIQGKGGLKFRTKLEPIYASGNELTVSGRIEAFDERTGQWRHAGDFTRRLNMDTKSIYNASMFMRDTADFKVKNGGFQSVFNPHAWTWAQAAGFKSVGVSAADDGRYVWGRAGFRSPNDYTYRNLADQFDNEIAKFEGGRPSIIRNAQDAAIIKMLVQKSKDNNHNALVSPAHADYIAALSNGNTAYEKDLKTWFTNNAAFSHGVMEFSDIPMIANDARSVPPPPPASVFVDPSLAPDVLPKVVGQNRFKNVDDAIRHLHSNNGNLSDVPDGVVVEAVLDDNIRGLGGVNLANVTREQIMLLGPSGVGVRRPNPWSNRPGDKFENDRYIFENIKPAPSFNRGVWEVLKVKDKQTGETWFMKTSQYGLNDGLLENIGMNIAQNLGFANNDNHLRLGEVIEGANGAPMRWMMMRDIADWQQGPVPIRGGMVNAREFRGDPSKIVAQDAARIAVMDFLFDNTDRHGENFLLGTDANGRVRIGIIDNGLLAGGRIAEGAGRPITIQEIQAWAAGAGARTISNYARERNGGIGGLLNVGFAHRGAAEREKFAKQAEKSVKKIEEQLDQILSIQRIEANGVKLTDVEKAHIEAIRQVATARIEYMKNGGGLTDLVNKF